MLNRDGGQQRPVSFAHMLVKEHDDCVYGIKMGFLCIGETLHIAKVQQTGRSLSPVHCLQVV